MTLLRLALHAFLACLAAPAGARDVTLSAPDGGIAVEGRLLDFNGEFYRVDTIYGALTLDAGRVVCTGDACPDLEAWLSEVSISGSAAMGGLLLPALIEGFADRMGYRAERTLRDDRTFAYVLRESTNRHPALRFDFRLSTSDEGFADLLAGEADITLSSREIRPEELARARDAGLGDLSQPGRSRVLVLDGLVAVTGQANPVRAIAIRDLARAFSGDIRTWTEVGGSDAPINLHLREPSSGIAQNFDDLVLRRYGLQVSAEIVRHPDNQSLVDAVAADPFALGVTAFSETGNTRPIALGGPCGFPVLASVEGLKTEDYPLAAPAFVYLPARRLPKLARDFLSFVQSPAATLIVRRAGFVDQRPDLIPIDRQGLRLANAVRQSGQGVGLADLREMVDRLFDADRLTVTYRFAEGASTLDAQSRSNVDLLAEEIERGIFDDRTLVFAGFSDGRGDAEQNRRLSERRARAVRDAVLAAVPAADLSRLAIEVVGFGEAMPMACDEVEWGQRINRRVEVWVR